MSTCDDKNRFVALIETASAYFFMENLQISELSSNTPLFWSSGIKSPRYLMDTSISGNCIPQRYRTIKRTVESNFVLCISDTIQVPKSNKEKSC